MNPRPAKFAPFKASTFYNLIAFVIGAKAANAINVALQLQNAQGKSISGVAHVEAYLSDNADGSTLTATVPTSTTVIGVNGKILVVGVTDKVFTLITDSSGRVDLTFTQTASPVTYYLVVRMPDGSLVVSGAVTF